MARRLVLVDHVALVRTSAIQEPTNLVRLESCILACMWLSMIASCSSQAEISCHISLPLREILKRMWLAQTHLEWAHPLSFVSSAHRDSGNLVEQEGEG